MKHYKQILLNKIIDSGWELESTNIDTDWWLEEIWSIKSVRENWGKKLFISFLVDPQYDGNNKSQAVWAISVTTDIPSDRIIAEKGMVLIDLVKGKLDQNITNLVISINKHNHLA